MLHIHYTEGPEVLRDVSIDTSDEVIDMLKKGIDYSAIYNQLELPLGSVEAIDIVRKSGLKRCCFCGYLFDSNHTKRNTCYKDKHYLPCIDCGKLIEVKESYLNYMKAGGRRCPECRGKQIGSVRRNKSKEEKAAIVAKQQATMIDRYGAATPLQVPEIKTRIQSTIKQRYGVDNLSQSKEIQDKIRQHSQEKYGVDHYTNAPEIRKRMIDGMIEKYGVPYAQQCAEIHERTKQTNLERYGFENIFQSKESKDNCIKDALEKYGVDWSYQSPH